MTDTSKAAGRVLEAAERISTVVWRASNAARGGGVSEIVERA